MDRQIVWPGAIPLETDLLNTNRNTMVALGMLAQTLMGATTAVSGLACTQTTVASWYVNIGQGAIYSLQNIDNSAYSSLALDTTDQIVKQGLLLASAGQQLGPMSAPVTAGYSVVYLVEAAFAETDTNAVVLPYYNSSNPASPYSGPSNTGATNYTLRKGGISLQLKVGTAAATGTQVAPATDSGYVPLYYITVAYGQTSVTNANIAVAPAAPFLTGNLQGIPGSVQNRQWSYAADTGAANAYAIALTPAVTAYTAGQDFTFKALNANTGASTLNVNGLGAKSIVHPNSTACVSGDILAGQLVTVRYDGTNFQLIASTSTTVAHSQTTNGYTTLPDGTILQWGTTGSITYNTPTTINLPLTFPNAFLSLVMTRKTQPSGSQGADTANIATTSTFTIQNNQTTAASYTWQAIGY